MRPWYEPPVVMMPAFEGSKRGGGVFRTEDLRQHHHLVVAFVQKDGPELEALAARQAEIVRHNGAMVVVCPPGTDLRLPPDVPVVEDAGGAIAAKYRPLVSEWQLPVAFVADRYGELMTMVGAAAGNIADRVVGCLFSAEVQCSL